MNGSHNAPQAPVLLAERVIDDRALKYGKGIVERDFKMANGKIIPILCVVGPGLNPYIIFPLTDHGTVYLVNQFRFATNEMVLELPGGAPEPEQKHWQEVAKAELLQEVGAEATTMSIIGKPIAFNPALQDAKFFTVLATGCKIVKAQKLDATEWMRVTEVSLANFRVGLRSGLYCDAKTVSAGYLALDHLGLL